MAANDSKGTTAHIQKLAETPLEALALVPTVLSVPLAPDITSNLGAVAIWQPCPAAGTNEGARHG